MATFNLIRQDIEFEDYLFDVETECECTHYLHEEQTWNNPGCDEFEYKVNDFDLKNIRVWHDEIFKFVKITNEELLSFNAKEEKIRNMVFEILTNDYMHAYEAFITAKEKDCEDCEL